jgi:phosphopentomutase
LREGPHEIGTRESFGDLGHTIADLLGVEVKGLLGASFADRIGFGT